MNEWTSLFVVALVPLALAGVDVPSTRETVVDIATLSLDAKEEFLRNADVIERKPLDVGITKSHKLTLSNGKLTHAAHLQSVDRIYRKLKSHGRTYVNVHDNYRYNIAAYRLDRVLGLNMVPVSVERQIGRKDAAVTWWVDDVQMMEKDRREAGIQPPNPADYFRQFSRATLFNQWVGNIDANATNLLITDDWRLRMIDFTRAFYPAAQVKRDLPLRIDRALYEKLASVTEESLAGLVGDYLNRREIRALLGRRDRIVNFYRQRVADKGEAVVLREATS